jgi:putative transposase
MAKIDHSISVCRLVYNLALEIKMYAYKTQGVSFSSFDLCYQLVDLKKGFDWIKSVDSQALQASVKKIDVAFKNFFNGRGYPKFKSKNSTQSFGSSLIGANQKVDFENRLLSIPKISNIPIKLSRTFEGKIKTVTISRTPTKKYFASILVETNDFKKQLQTINPATTIGIDTGIKSFVVSSDGRTFEANKKLKSSLRRLKCLQRRASRKIKRSNNRKKANKRVAILHEKITNQRLDYIHKVTHNLTSDNQAVSSICIEDLNVVWMLKNHKLAQAISDVSLGKFYEILGYKCKWQGINLIKIGRFEPSSKECNICGAINKELKLQHREWTCDNCGITHDRDFNAAINIKNKGLNKTSVGSREEPVELLAIARAKKQESILV